MFSKFAARRKCVDNSRALWRPFCCSFRGSLPVKKSGGVQQVQTANQSMQGLFGVFADSLPDGWGLLVIGRAFQKLGLSFVEANVLEKLGIISTHGMGAITYKPSLDANIYNEFSVDLAAMSLASAQISAGSAKEMLPELLLIAGSPGGARPKITVAIEKNKMDGDFFRGSIISWNLGAVPERFESWIIKFRSKE